MFFVMIYIVVFIPNQNIFASDKREFNDLLKLSISEPNWTSTFQQASLIVIDGLLKVGYQNLGDLNLVTLKKEVSTLNWRLIQATNIEAGSEGSRSTAVYSIGDKLIIMSLEEWLNTEPSLRAIIALHEALGALGYSDENYQISVALAQLNALSTVEGAEMQNLLEYNKIISFLETAPVFKNVIKNTDHILLADGADNTNGGVTGLGGGGDIRALTIKFFLLTIYPVLMKIQNKTDSELIRNTFYLLLDCEIESSTESNNLTEHKENIDNTKVSFYQGKLKITIPKNIYFFYSRKQAHINWSAQYSLNLINKILNLAESYP